MQIQQLTDPSRTNCVRNVREYLGSVRCPRPIAKHVSTLPSCCYYFVINNKNMAIFSLSPRVLLLLELSTIYKFVVCVIHIFPIEALKHLLVIYKFVRFSKSNMLLFILSIVHVHAYMCNERKQHCRLAFDSILCFCL